MPRLEAIHLDAQFPRQKLHGFPSKQAKNRLLLPPHGPSLPTLQ